MTLPSEDLRQEILAHQPALRAFAGRLTENETEAERLTQLTMTAALGEQPELAQDDDRDTRLWMFGLLRGVFHSVARRRDHSRGRGAPAAVWNADRAAAFAAPREIIS